MKNIPARIWIPVVTIVLASAGYVFVSSWSREGANLDISRKDEPTRRVADWHTYISERYGYELRFPPDWTLDVEEDSHDVGLSPQHRTAEELATYGGPLFLVSVKENPSNLPLREFYKEYLETFFVDPAKTIPQTLTIDGKQAFVFSEDIGYYVTGCTVIVPLKNRFLEISVFQCLDDEARTILQNMRISEEAPSEKTR